LRNDYECIIVLKTIIGYSCSKLWSVNKWHVRAFIISAVSVFKSVTSQIFHG